MGFVRDRLPDPVGYFESLGLPLRGPGKWGTTRCDFHGGSDSMRVHRERGAWVCMACGAKGGDVLAFQMAAAGQGFIDAACSLGAWQDDGKSEPPPRPRNFSASDGLQVLEFESLLAWTAACNLAQGMTLTDDDRARLGVAAQRIHTIREATR